MKRLIPTCSLFLVVASLVMAQRRFGGGRGGGGWGGGWAGDAIRTARELPSGSTGTPVWTNPRGFEKDVFTFTRIRYNSGGYGYGRRAVPIGRPDGCS